jgi:hypothetical protein
MNQQKTKSPGNQKNWPRFFDDVMRIEEMDIAKFGKPIAVSSPFKYKIASPTLKQKEKGKEVFESTCSEIWIG